MAKTSFIGKADPYVKIKIGMQEKQTRVDQKGGQKPVFGDKFEFKISNEKELQIEVYDKETLQVGR